MSIQISKKQAQRLWDSAMDFSDSWREQEDRFEVYDDQIAAFEGIPNQGWSMYWCPSSAHQVLLEAFFQDQGIEARCLWDLAMADINLQAKRDIESPYVVMAEVSMLIDVDYWSQP